MLTGERQPTPEWGPPSTFLHEFVWTPFQQLNTTTQLSLWVQVAYTRGGCCASGGHEGSTRAAASGCVPALPARGSGPAGHAPLRQLCGAGLPGRSTWRPTGVSSHPLPDLSMTAVLGPCLAKVCGVDDCIPDTTTPPISDSSRYPVLCCSNRERRPIMTKAWSVYTEAVVQCGTLVIL